MHFNYPPEKIEWIIIDEGKEPINKLLPNDSRIKYFYYDDNAIKELYANYVNYINKRRQQYNDNMKLPPKQRQNIKKYKQIFRKPFSHIPIGMKRNIANQYATGDIIIHMDDDDYMPENSIIERVNHLIKIPKESIANTCVGCFNIGAFDVNRLVSVVYKSPENLLPCNRISCGSLGYWRVFWESNKFDNQDTYNEHIKLVKGRKCINIDWNNIIVQLFHKKNKRNTKIFDREPNGWYFGEISNEAFLIITSDSDISTTNT